METLSFRIPEQQPAREGAFDTTPSAVKRWVEELPVGNTGEAAKRLYLAIREVNGLLIPVSERFGMMETLVVPLDKLLAALERHYIGSHFPLPHKALRVAEFNCQLLAEVVIAYQAVLNDEERASWSLKLTHRNLWARCVHRLLHYRGRILNTFRIIHRPYPTGSWVALHKLYLEAKQRGRSRTRLTPLWRDGELATISDSYKHAILMDMLEPELFSLQQREEIRHNIRNFLPKVKLISPQQCKKGKECLCIRLDVDMPHAVRLSQCRGKRGHKVAGVILDISELGALLDHALRAEPQSDRITLHRSHTALSRETVELLRQCWKVPEGEREERVAVNKPVQAAVGMSALFSLMREEYKGSHDGITDQELTGELKPLDRALTIKRTRKTATTKSRLEGEDSILYRGDLYQSSWAMDGDEKNYRLIEARELNYTNTGYCLEFNSKELEALNVGELIGYREQERDTMQLCAVRWLEEQENTLLVGLVRLAREIEPLLVLMELERGNTPLRSLLGIGEDGRPQLFMPNLPAIHEYPLQVVVDNREIPIELHDKMGFSPLFAAYRFSAAEALHVASLEKEMDLVETNRLLHEIARSDEMAPPSMARGDFSDLWDSL